ncbi:hypothetical protein D3C75_991950 [compost metagenome]
MIAEQLHQAVSSNNGRNKDRNHVHPADPAHSKAVIETHIDRKNITDSQYKQGRNHGDLKRKDDVGAHQLVRKQKFIIGQVVAAPIIREAFLQRAYNRQDDDKHQN